MGPKRILASKQRRKKRRKEGSNFQHKLEKKTMLLEFDEKKLREVKVDRLERSLIRSKHLTPEGKNHYALPTT